MGHEYVHVSHLSLGLDYGRAYIGGEWVGAKSEYGAYYYNDVVKGTTEKYGKTQMIWIKHAEGITKSSRWDATIRSRLFRDYAPYRNYKGWGLPTSYPKF